MQRFLLRSGNVMLYGVQYLEQAKVMGLIFAMKILQWFQENIEALK